MKKCQRTSREIRFEHNREIVTRMKSGDSLQSFDSASSWFPPRPVIQKNKEDVSKLYGSAVQVLSNKSSALKSAEAVDTSANIVHLVTAKAADDKESDRV